MEHFAENLEFLPNSSNDRCAGILIGLAACDRNGGPIRLALRLAQSLLDNRKFDQEQIVGKYFDWFRGPPHDHEKAFDTGNTFHTVFTEFSRGVSIKDAAENTQKKFGSIGVGAAHRNVVLSLANFITDENLAEAVQEETYITHANNISFEVSLICNIICRDLLKMKSWEQAIQHALSVAKEPEVKDAILKSKGSNCCRSDLSRDGYAPLVLRAALYFLQTETTFESALLASISFAGSANFCPVLVGTIGGARYGSSSILTANSNGLLKHCSKDLLAWTFKTANEFAKLWAADSA